MSVTRSQTPVSLLVSGVRVPWKYDHPPPSLFVRRFTNVFYSPLLFTTLLFRPVPISFATLTFILKRVDTFIGSPSCLVSHKVRIPCGSCFQNSTLVPLSQISQVLSVTQPSCHLGPSPRFLLLTLHPSGSPFSVLLLEPLVLSFRHLRKYVVSLYKSLLARLI